ncbi:ABC-type Fe3+-siderophore transport system, permease 2 component [Leucobacter sp. 7(1)]|uniref:FecCD family ABC transporter permease n=1 Tax=Leucobacter sp. 7(1) TaxID=1255613 RepID=UPI00097F25D7|nr:iron chelate uptake ABC transporter family permease subunit [Leucobacter sp. 7(1)]SJN13430.1 ABC-type Fe3+-siderophore transport system, permease 2 component [Leucobacter sp. 7(1)]
MAGPGPSGTVIRVGPYSIRVRSRALVVGGIGALVLVAIIVASLMIGARDPGFGGLAAVLSGEASPSATRSVLGRRLPRALTAALVGGLLGMSGAVFQSLSRNPLGSPDIIGFTAGAATAAVFQIVVLGGGMLATAAAAVIGGILTALAVYWLARRDGVSGGIRLVLVGIGVGAIVSALSALLIARADLDDAMLAQLWSAGSLTGRGWIHVVTLLLVAAVTVPVLCGLARPLALMEMGDDSAQGVGVRVERVRFLVMLVAVAIAAAATAAAGPIAFIAFAAGQISRRLAPVPGVLVGLSAVVGAVLLTAADLLAQHLDVGVRTPVGLVTSVLGGIYLLWLLARRI